MPFARFLAGLLTIAFFCKAPSIYASGSNAAAAEAWFQEGRAALSRGDYEKACLGFEESLRLQAAVGAALNLAACEEKRGRYASSWERWHQALNLMKPGDQRHEFAQMKAKEMAELAPRLTVSSRSEWKDKLTITSGGGRLGHASYGRPLPVDPGKWVIKVESAGRETRVYQLAIKVGEKRSVIVEPGPPLTSQGTSRDNVDARQTQQIFAAVATGIGVVGLGTAIVTAVLLPGIQETVDANCQGNLCNATGLDAGSKGQAILAANTAGWVAAGVGLAAGTALFLTLPSPKNDLGAQQVALGFDGDGATLSVRGMF